MKQKIDYGKIVFVGIPLSFIVWVATLLILLFFFRGSSKIFPLSYVLTGIFTIAYWVFAVKNAKKVGAINVEPNPNDPLANAKKPMSNAQIIYAAVLVIALFGSLGVAVIIYNIPNEKAFQYVAPFFILVVLGEKIYLKIKTHNQHMKSDEK